MQSAADKVLPQGYLKVAVQMMPEEKRSNSTPSPVEFREKTEEEVKETEEVLEQIVSLSDSIC